MVALKWAYQRELIDRDLYNGITYFAGSKTERQILTPELAQALFSIGWDSKHAELANKLSMVTGLRVGEILALRVQDLGNDCLYIRHSYNDVDGLKVTKNTESRIVELPFKNIMQDLINLAKENPHNEKLDGFIFCGLVEGKPIDRKVFVKYLRYGLLKIGMSDEESKKITFHAWRHFFTTYMKDRLNDKLLQQQTGHKTHSMLEHYSRHRTQSDKQILQQAQIEVFADILNPVEYKIIAG
ncbi:MAG: tyrosine-type recombinase/integrase [Treponemataceae bacterium]